MGIQMGGASDSGYDTDDFASDSDAKALSLPAEGSSVFSEDVLKIEISGPSADYLTVIDVPGIFRMHTEGVTTEEDIAMVRRMVCSHIQDSRTVILAVLPSNIDVSTQEILTLAEKYDPKGERTLGILTKPDLVTEASAKEAVCNIIRGKRKKLTLGYYLVRGRGADQNDEEFARREEIFKEKPWNTLPPERVGIKALKARLAELLGHIARLEFPKLRKDVSDMLQAAEKEMVALGPSRKDEHEQRRFLSDIAGRFQKLVRQALEAQYAGESAFEDSTDLRLVTQIVNLADEFSEEFEELSVFRRFQEEKQKNSSKNETKTKSILESTQPFEPEEFPELGGIISTDFDVDEPYDDIIDWLDELYTRSRGMELGTFSSSVWASAWREQSKKWPSMSKAFMSKVVVAIHRFIMAALREACPDPDVHDELWSAIHDELLHRYQDGMAQAELLVSAERDTKPYTLDQRFNEKRQIARGNRIAEQLLGYSVRRDDDKWVTVNQVKSTAEEMSNKDDVIEKLHDDLSAYYEIAKKRFVDNLLNQAVNYRLLFGPRTPLDVLNHDWVIGLKKEELESIAGESPSIKEYRERLGVKIAELAAARKILRQ